MTGFESFTIDATATPAVAPQPKAEVKQAAALVAQPNERILKALANLRKSQQATFDAARNSPDLARYWKNADAFDADSAHSKEVRHTLIKRSRYEVANNGYADGIAQTYATDLVGVGPTLRMQTGSKPFNRLVELEWFRWCKATQFRRKLWCMAHAKHTDGEAFAVMRRNPRLNHRVQVDLVLYEAEQCQTPFVPFDQPGYIDGIKFDEFGNPEIYDFLHEHPGDTQNLTLTFEPERVPAEFVLHWFKMRRPGQHRGVPESASTLNLGASFRRLREASLSTAEKVAAWTLFLKSLYQPTQEEAEAVESMEQLEIYHGMITTLPNTVEPFQLSAEQPGPQYDSFHKTLLNEQARPKNMPYNKAACDSSSYNYASGRLDHQTYYGALDVDRADGDDRVLDPTFSIWFDLAIKAFGWLGGDPSLVGPAAREHLWDWPKHRVADVESEANANKTKLQSGQMFLPQLYSEQGLDFEDAVEDAATKLGVPPEDLLKRLVDVTLPPTIASVSKPDAATGEKPAPPESQAASLLAGRLNGHALNGSHHEN